MPFSYCYQPVGTTCGKRLSGKICPRKFLRAIRLSLGAQSKGMPDDPRALLWENISGFLTIFQTFRFKQFLFPRTGAGIINTNNTGQQQRLFDVITLKKQRYTWASWVNSIVSVTNLVYAVLLQFFLTLQASCKKVIWQKKKITTF